MTFENGPCRYREVCVQRQMDGVFRPIEPSLFLNAWRPGRIYCSGTPVWGRCPAKVRDGHNPAMWFPWTPFTRRTHLPPFIPDRLAPREVFWGVRFVWIVCRRARLSNEQHVRAATARERTVVLVKTLYI
jgi:hypothetical protein